MKNHLRLVIIIIIAVMVEVFVFNFSNIINIVDSNLEKNKVFTMNDMEFINWDSRSKGMESQLDPMIIIPNINTYIKKIEVYSNIENSVPFIMFYYTGKQNEVFNDEFSFAITNYNDDYLSLDIKDFINDLRIDIGDNAGTKLNDITVIINPFSFDFNISRVIAIILICILSIWLFGLQDSPTYSISER